MLICPFDNFLTQETKKKYFTSLQLEQILEVVFTVSPINEN